MAGNGLDFQDGPGDEASLNNPDSMVVGPNGEIYFVQRTGEDGASRSAS